MEELTELGKLLRSTREQKKITLEDVQKAIKIKPSFVTGLETLNVKIFPSEMYFKWFLKSYASFLGLNPMTVVTMYENEKNGKKAPAIEETSTEKTNVVKEPKPAKTVATPKVEKAPKTEKSKKAEKTIKTEKTQKTEKIEKAEKVSVPSAQKELPFKTVKKKETKPQLSAQAQQRKIERLKKIKRLRQLKKIGEFFDSSLAKAILVILTIVIVFFCIYLVKNKYLSVLESLDKISQAQQEDMSAGKNVLLFEASEDTLVSVSIGEDVIFDGVINLGEVKKFYSEKNFTFKVGNVDTVTVIFNDNIIDVSAGADKDRGVSMTIGND